MEKLLSNKKILVAGACGLLGSHLVKELLKEGAKVIAADINIESMIERLQQQNVDPDDIEFYKLDVTNENDVKNFFSKVDGMTGAVNATYPRNQQYGAHFFDVTLSSFNENLSLHLGSAFLFSQQCAAYFKENKQAFSLVNVASIYGVVTPKFDIYKNTLMTMPVEYAAIKSALIHLNRYIVAYVSDSRFRINCISPGGIFDHQPESFINAYKAQSNGAGMLDADDMVGSVVFLLSEKSRYVTAQNIIIDDGFSL